MLAVMVVHTSSSKTICVKPTAPAIKEQRLHRQIAQFLSVALLPPAWFTTVPAGGGGLVRGKILKGLGLKIGVPDVLVCYQGIAHFIEIKTRTGRVAPEQKACHADLVAAGCKVGVARSIDDVVSLLTAWGIPTRVVVGQ